MKKEILNKIRKYFPLVVFSLVVISLSCASGEAPTPGTKLLEKPEAPAIKEKATWEQEWDNLIKEARKEGRLTFRTSMERDTADALRKHFGGKYGIDMDITSGKDEEMNAKIFAERAAGLFLADFYMEGPTSPLLIYKPKGVIQRLDSLVFRPDILDEKLWWRGYGPYFDKDHMVAGGTRTVSPFVIINNNIVKREEIRSYYDLLEPRWKGKIVIGDPTVSGVAQAVMRAALEIMGEDYIKKLAEQVGMITRDKRQLVDWVVREKYPIGLGSGGGIVVEFLRSGVTNIDLIVLKEGSLVTGTGVAVLFDRAPHPDAAKLFINWFLSKEGQEIYTTASAKLSRRLDVSGEHLLPVLRVEKDAQYITESEESYLKQPQLKEIIDKHYKK